MSFALQSLSALRGIGIVVLLAIAFLFGLATTVYLSLRSPEVTVPEVVGKDRFEAEKILAQSDLNFRVRAYRPSNQVKADTVLFQLPRAGDVVKAGQTVAMDISRTTMSGEASQADATDKKLEEEKAANANASKNENENRPRRPRNTNVNKNVNENGNANSATNSSPNANARVNANSANSTTNRPVNENANLGRNTNQRPTNQNDNRRPVIPKASPKPTPGLQNDNR